MGRYIAIFIKAIGFIFISILLKIFEFWQQKFQIFIDNFLLEYEIKSFTPSKNRNLTRHLPLLSVQIDIL